MWLLLILIALPIIGWRLGKSIGKSIFPEQDNSSGTPSSNNIPNITIHNHVTENHLHLTEEQLKRLRK